MISLLGNLVSFILICYFVFADNKGVEIYTVLKNINVTEIFMAIFFVYLGWFSLLFFAYHLLDEKYKLRQIYPFEKLGLRLEKIYNKIYWVNRRRK